MNKENRKAGTGRIAAWRLVPFPAFLLSLFVLPFLARGHEGEPPVPAGQVAINFALPEMDGTISLGIYNATGKLVRTLHREAPESDFVKGLNGLITYWDGKNNAGSEVAAGKYLARGYVVGEVTFEGEAYHFNDFIAGADSPRIRRIVGLRALPGGVLRLEAELIGGARKFFLRDGEGGIAPALSEAGEAEVAENPWTIETTDEGTVVRQGPPEGEALRALAIDPREPKPIQVAPAPDEEVIFLLEEDAGSQRIRKLTLEAAPTEGESAVSKWRSAVLGEIRRSDELAQVKDQLVTAAEKKIELGATIRVALVANPLKQDEKPSAEIGVGIEKGGSFLQLPDGLPLRRVSQTPGLKWTAIGREEGEGPVTIFQSDGAVVEEFTARGLENMIALDAGELDFPPEAVKAEARNGEL